MTEQNQFQIQMTSSPEATNIKTLIYGASGVGKTTLLGTCKNPIILDFEGGTLSLSNKDIPFYKLNSFSDLEKVYDLVKDGQYDWICIDSVSKLSELYLTELMTTKSNGLQAYGEMADNLLILLNKFFKLPSNVAVVFQMARVKNDVTGEVLCSPSGAGKKLAEQITYLVDEVFCLHSKRNKDGEVKCVVQTNRDEYFDAKDRSGKLDFWERPDMTLIEQKINAKNDNKTKEEIDF